MNASGQRHCEEAAGLTPARPQTVLVLYEDCQIGTVTRSACERFEARLLAAPPPVRCMWKFDALENRALQPLVVLDGGQADLIVVAAREGAELPRPVRVFLERTLARTPPPALGALLLPPHQADNAATPVGVYLSRLARKNGQPFHDCQSSGQFADTSPFP